jgi:hypothetical protein
MEEGAWVICKHCASSQKGLEHPWIVWSGVRECPGANHGCGIQPPRWPWMALSSWLSCPCAVCSYIGPELTFVTNIPQ